MAGPFVFLFRFGRALGLQVVLDQPLNQGLKVLSCAWQYKGRGSLIPVELEACGKRRNPDLAHRCVRRNHEFCRRIVEDYVEQSTLSLDFETSSLVLFEAN